MQVWSNAWISAFFLVYGNETADDRVPGFFEGFSRGSVAEPERDNKCTYRNLVHVFLSTVKARWVCSCREKIKSSRKSWTSRIDPVKTSVKQNVYKTKKKMFHNLLNISLLHNFSDYANDKNNEARLPGYCCVRVLYVIWTWISPRTLNYKVDLNGCKLQIMS